MQASSRNLLLALGAIFTGPIYADNVLLVSANTPVVSVERRSPEQNFLHLPHLEYNFTLKATCGDDLQPVSIQLSVADTRRFVRGDDIHIKEGEDTTIGLTLRIPQEQIAPVAIKGFCMLPADDLVDGGSNYGSNNEITIPAALSAQASLRCASESAEQTVYVSRPLDVTLTCAKPTEVATPP